MNFPAPLVKGSLIKRYKRFLADVQLDSGELVTAHCPNTGAMTGCAEPGYTVYLRHDGNPKRKLAYTWELAVDNHGNWIGVNTHNANKVVGEWLRSNTHFLGVNYASVKPELKLEPFASRFDFALRNADNQILHIIEVKSVTLCNADIGYFPDAVTTRGKRHCEELTALVEQGIPCAIVFCIQHTGIDSFKPAEHIDPKYAQALRTASATGVEIAIATCDINPESIAINQLHTIKV